MSLYRKYRPQKFAELIGQDHIRQTISNALQGNSFSHAYLFSGPKGSGKTTIARLMAKALNCQGRVLGKDLFEPCNKCSSCKEIIAGNNLDIIEIDAASNRGIDEIRELRDKIRFAPTAGVYKVYIIDECHMLTKEAFNALLKTLEEPPKHAIFILATTELHKVPATILSRTQSFEFRKGSRDEIMKLLRKIVKEEKIKIDDTALELITSLSYGAFRDAVSILDQVSALGIDGRHTISFEETQILLGQTTESTVWEFTESISFKDRKKALKIVEKIYFEGKDLENFIAQTVSLLRKIILFKEDLLSDFESTKEEKKRLEQMAKSQNAIDFVNIIEKLTTASVKVKTSIMGQLPLEIAVFEITENQNSNPPAGKAGIKIQNEILKIKENDKDKKSEEKSEITKTIIAKKETKIEEKILKDIDSNKFDAAKWPEVIKVVKSHNNAIAAMIKNTVFKKTQDHNIILAVKFKFHAEQICNKKNLTVIENAVSRVTGEVYRVDCVVDKDLNIKKPLEAEEELLNGAKEVFEVEE